MVKKLLTCMIFAALPTQVLALDVTLQGYIEPEATWFVEDGALPDQENYNLSLAAQTELDLYWANDRVHIAIHPFGRVDMQDEERTHWDLREARFEVLPFENLALSIGAQQVFWGVTEVVHLVDTVNQTDALEGFDGEDKLGQPMVQAVLDMGDFGIFSGMVMPFFRERAFPGDEGRPRFPLPINRNYTTYESTNTDRHIDWAARYSIVLGDFDLGLSYFSGTARAPELAPIVFVDGEVCAPYAASAHGRPACPEPPGFPINLLPAETPDIDVALAPHYPLMEQLAFDGQATLGAWLLKLEMAGRHVNNQYDFATTGGIEYSFYQIFGTDADLGLVLEYAFDDRGQDLDNPFQNDLFFGFRWAANNVASTAVLVAAGYDTDNSTTSLSVEGDTRIGDSFKLTLEGRFFLDVAEGDPFTLYQNDSFAKLQFGWYF